MPRRKRRKTVSYSEIRQIARIFNSYMYHPALPHPLELATGLEKQEPMAALRGVTNPYDLEGMKRVANSKEKPMLVRSWEEKRIIGCVCTTSSSSSQSNLLLISLSVWQATKTTLTSTTCGCTWASRSAA